MGDEGVATINDAGASSAPATTPSSDELVSTVELSPAMDADATPEGGAKSEAEGGEQTADGKTAEGEQTAGDATSGDDSADRFDKHPRFIELNSRMKAAEDQNRQLVEQNKALMDRFDKMMEAQAKPTGETELPYKDINKMTEEELLDWQSEDPKGYLANIDKMVAYKVEQGLKATQEQTTKDLQMQDYEKAVEKTYDAYAKENPDFEEMWDSGELQKFRDANPGHTAISAHQVLTQEKRIQAAVDKAVKEALDKAESDRRSTRKAASVLGPGPARSTTTASSDEELKTPAKYGGTTSVLANRLARMRQAGTG